MDVSCFEYFLQTFFIIRIEFKMIFINFLFALFVSRLGVHVQAAILNSTEEFPKNFSLSFDLTTKISVQTFRNNTRNYTNTILNCASVATGKSFLGISPSLF